MGLLEKERWSQVPTSRILALVWISSFKSALDSTSFIWFHIVHVHNKAEGAYRIWWNQRGSAAWLTAVTPLFHVVKHHRILCALVCIGTSAFTHRGLVKHWPCLNKVYSWGYCECVSFMTLIVIYFDNEGYGSFRGRQWVMKRQDRTTILGSTCQFLLLSTWVKYKLNGTTVPLTDIFL